jgi:hypothetical protein
MPGNPVQRDLIRLVRIPGAHDGLPTLPFASADTMGGLRGLLV